MQIREHKLILDSSKGGKIPKVLAGFQALVACTRACSYEREAIMISFRCLSDSISQGEGGPARLASCENAANVATETNSHQDFRLIAHMVSL
jgi:hypothetical protein